MDKLFFNAFVVFMLMAFIQLILIGFFDSGIEFINQDHTISLSKRGFLLIAGYLATIFGSLAIKKSEPFP